MSDIDHIDTTIGTEIPREPDLGELARMVTPLAYRDIYEAMQEHGIVGGTALGILSMFGMGVQTYEESK